MPDVLVRLPSVLFRHYRYLVVPVISTSILSTGLCHSPPRYRVDAAGLSFKKQTRKTSKGKKLGEVKECILVQKYDVHVRRCDNVSLR